MTAKATAILRAGRFLLLLTGLLLLVMPVLWVPVLIVNLIYGLGIYVLRFVMLPVAPRSFQGALPKGTASGQTQPFFSIHLPVCREPPEVVQRTLACLETIHYERYEVIVISNNTDDEKLWRPLQSFCSHRPRFKFRHEPRLSGYKAGALNIALEMTSSKADWILTVDADYKVYANILNLAVPWLDGVGYVQFPQAYSDTDSNQDSLAHELGHFFSLYMTHANSYRCPLLTGTLSFVRKSSLERIGGWANSSITEDAETGIELVCSGLRGRYVDRVAGRGLLPGAVPAFCRQRQRWAFGNAQTLPGLFRPDLNVSTGQRLSMLLQLTAWHEFILLPAMCAVFIAMSHLLNPFDAGLALLAAGASFAGFLLLNLAFFLIKFRSACDWRGIVHHYLVHQGVAWEANASWIEALLGRKLSFIRTNKFRSSTAARLSRSVIVGLLIHLVVTAYFIHLGYLLPATLFLLGHTVLVLGQIELVRVFSRPVVSEVRHDYRP